MLDEQRLSNNGPSAARTEQPGYGREKVEGRDGFALLLTPPYLFLVLPFAA